MASVVPRRPCADFYNKIGTKRTCGGELTMSAPEGRADSLFRLVGFMSTRPS